MNKNDCNIDLLDDVSRKTGENPKLVKEVIGSVSSFLANMIREGAFETLLIPYFGKFQPKTKELQWTMERRGYVYQPKIKQEDNEGAV